MATICANCRKKGIEKDYRVILARKEKENLVTDELYIKSEFLLCRECYGKYQKKLNDWGTLNRQDYVVGEENI